MDVDSYGLQKGGDDTAYCKSWHGSTLPSLAHHGSHFQRYFVSLFSSCPVPKSTEGMRLRKASSLQQQQTVSMLLYCFLC